MASIQCPNCGQYQAIPVEELGPGCVAAPALLLGFVAGVLAHPRFDGGAIGVRVLELGIGILAIVGGLWSASNSFPSRCEHCGFTLRSRKAIFRNGP